jgi:two-component system response regulator MtrA
MPNPQTKQYAILVIEDDLELGNVVKEILELEGFETEIIRDGAQAYPAVAARKPALIVLDMRLPNASGLEILNQIRADDRLKNVKILATTVDHQIASVAESTADRVFTKPFRLDQLLNLVTQLLPDKTGSD